MSATPSRLTERDRFLLEALAELRLITVSQAAHWLGVTPETASRRIGRLADAGLVISDRISEHEPRMARITEAGLRRIDSPLHAPGLKRDEYAHDVGVAWLWGAAQAGALGPVAEVLTERRMRSDDARRARMSAGSQVLEGDGRFWGVGYSSGAAGAERRHYPDLMLINSGGRRTALELELSSKGPRRLVGVMSDYAADLRIDRVLYLAGTAQIARAVRTAADRTRVGRLLQVDRLPAGWISARGRGEGGGRVGASRAGRAGRAGRDGARGVGPSARTSPRLSRSLRERGLGR